jgi:hypothetical protein
MWRESKGKTALFFILVLFLLIICAPLYFIPFQFNTDVVQLGSMKLTVCAMVIFHLNLQLSRQLVNCNVSDLILVGFPCLLYLAWVCKNIHTCAEGVDMV